MYKHYSTVGMAGDELKHQISGYTNTHHSLIRSYSKQTHMGARNNESWAKQSDAVWAAIWVLCERGVCVSEFVKVDWGMCAMFTKESLYV